jgi:hypothetical protein
MSLSHNARVPGLEATLTALSQVRLSARAVSGG